MTTEEPSEVTLAWSVEKARDRGECYVCGHNATTTVRGDHSRDGDVTVPVCAGCADDLDAEEVRP